MKFVNEEKLYSWIFRKKRKKFQKMEYLLKDWYGIEKGTVELSHYLPKEENLNDVIDSLLAKNLGPKEQKLMELKKNWGKIMGSQIEKISAPVSIKNNFLTIEVENSTWLMELKNFHGKIIEKKIREFCGEKFFFRINYVIKGKRKKCN